jgi:hypothetical protein
MYLSPTSGIPLAAAGSRQNMNVSGGWTLQSGRG